MSIKMRYFLFALFLLSCGPPPDCTTPTFKLRVFEIMQATCQDYEDQAAAFYRTFQPLGHIDPRFTDIENTLQGYQVHAKQENWACNDELCFAGQTYCPIRDIDLNEEYIPWHGILIHELVHAAQGCIAWPLDGGDPYPGFHTVAYGHESWSKHQIWEYIDYATESMIKAKKQRQASQSP